MGGSQTFHIDKTSFLILNVAWVSKLPMGTIPYEVFVCEYKKVDGILIAHRAKTRFMGQEMIFTMTSIEHNVQMPADLFKLPVEIQALLNKSKKN